MRAFLHSPMLPWPNTNYNSIDVRIG
jgi:hypothetical protein